MQKKGSFASLERWMGEVDRNSPAEVVKMVVGGKCDKHLEGWTEVPEEDAKVFAAKHGALCERCSAKDDSNVTGLFTSLGARIVRNGFGGKPAAAAKGAAPVKVGAPAAPGGNKKGCC